MSPVAAIIILAVLAALGALIVLQSRRSRPRAKLDPACTVERAWEHFFAHPEAGSARDRRALERLDESARQQLSDRLLPALRETCERAVASAEPLVVLRTAIMDATDRSLMVETLFEAGEEGGGPRHDPASDLEAGVLRRYSSLRFGDAGPDDWYTHYLRIAEMGARNVAAMLRKTLSGETSSLESTLQRPLADSLRETREGLLRLPPRTPFSRATPLAPPGQPEQQEPTPGQRERLTELMTGRFERLFTGRLYRREDGSPVDPAACFEVEAALVYALLAEAFRHPDEAWRGLLAHALGGNREAVSENEEVVLETGRRVHRARLDRRGSGDLEAGLRAACRRAFRERSLPDEEIAEIAADLHAEAAALAAAVQEIARRAE